MGKQSVRKQGRPPSKLAASHEQVLDAVYEILQDKSASELTIEEVARRAKVGKPTIYRWWPSKAALIMDLFEERLAANLKPPQGAGAEQMLRTQVAQVIRQCNGFFGKVLADIIAEGQGNADALAAYREYVSHRRAAAIVILERAYQDGELRRPINADLLIDMIYGPIYYRLLVRHLPLDEPFGDDLVSHLMSYLKS